MSEIAIKEIVREELLQAKLPKKQYYPFLSGVIRGAGELHFTRIGFAVEIRHVDKRLIDLVCDVLTAVYKREFPTESNRMNVGYTDAVFYRVVVPQDVSAHLLEKTRIVRNRYDFTTEIPKDFVESAESRRVLLRGLYLACGSIKIPKEEIIVTENAKSRGYTITFSLNSDQVKEDVVSLLCKEAQVERKNVFLKKTGSGIVLRSSEAICNVLTAMGCNEAPLLVYQVVVALKMKNDLNRAQNFDVANIDKTVRAVERQIEAIGILKRRGEYEALSEELKATCEMRLLHPELGIEQLGGEFSPPLTKSCVNHRLRKIVALAFGDKDKG